MREITALLTDYYELTMAQGYFQHRHNPRVVFDMFFRRQPFGGGFSVFAGLENLLQTVEKLRFSAEDLKYLDSSGVFSDEFLQYLADFRFHGEIYAMDEGALVFPDEPLLRVHATLIEAQIIESLLLNILNFQTLVATKAARVSLAAEGGKVMEFGLRRAQGVDGALSATRAAFLGGVTATSNTLAARLFGIPASGTMAHSWIMAFEDELKAFERYAELYPQGCFLLLDTYDTLNSGLKNAIRVGLKLKENGHSSFGVRLDSGDLEYLSKRVRERLNEAGLREAKIAASNELDEVIIHGLRTAGAPIDVWGVGTHLITGGADAALTGVYKLMAKEKDGAFQPTLKVSDNPEKVSNPGIKQVYRFLNGNAAPIADLLALEEEEIAPGRPFRFYHPRYSYRSMVVTDYERIEPMLSLKMKEGRIVCPLPPLTELQARVRRNLQSLDGTYKRILNPHVYKVSLSQKLRDLKFRLLEEFANHETGR